MLACLVSLWAAKPAQRPVDFYRVNYAWFIAFAPFDNPRLAIAVVVENARTGGQDAAPIARDAFAAHFDINRSDSADENTPVLYVD